MEHLRLKPRPSDIIPIVIVLALSIFPLNPSHEKPEKAVVYYRNEILLSHPLSRDTTIVVEGACGPWALEVSNGGVFVAETHCPNGFCRSMGKISRTGSAIICAPGKIAVVIEGGSDLDATTR